MGDSGWSCTTIYILMPNHERSVDIVQYFPAEVPCELPLTLMGRQAVDQTTISNIPTLEGCHPILVYHLARGES